MNYVKTSLLSLLFIAATGAYAQKNNHEWLIPYRLGSLWGYCDTAGNIKIKPAYEYVGLFEANPWAIVKQHNKTSLINPGGKLLMPFYADVAPLSDKTFVVQQNGKYGIYHKNKLTIPIEYQQIDDPYLYEAYSTTSNSMIGLKGGKYFLLDYATGRVKEIAAETVNNQTPLATVETAAFAADGLVSAPVGIVAEGGEHEGSRAVYKSADSIKKALALDAVAVSNYNIQTEVSHTQGRYCKLYKNGKVGIFHQGHLIAPQYGDVLLSEEMGNTVIMVSNNGLSGFISLQQKVLLPIAYNISFLQAGIYKILQGDKQGAIVFNHNTHLVVEAKYSDLLINTALSAGSAAKNGFIVFEATINGKKGYVGQNGVEYFKD